MLNQKSTLIVDFSFVRIIGVGNILSPEIVITAEKYIISAALTPHPGKTLRLALYRIRTTR
jgi:hypothetical protein